MTASRPGFTSADIWMTVLTLAIAGVGGWVFWMLFSLLWPDALLFGLFLGFVVVNGLPVLLSSLVVDWWRRSDGKPTLAEERASWPFLRRHSFSIGFVLGMVSHVVLHPKGAL